MTTEQHNDQSVQRTYDMLYTALRPIEDFLNDPDTVEVMLNPDSSIWVEKLGERPKLTNVVFSIEEAQLVIRIITSLMGDTVTPDNPRSSGTIPKWTARIQCAMPPLVENPAFCIRLPPKKVFTLENYVENKIMTQEQSYFIKEAVLAKKNILVGGGTGSGKTTLANAILAIMAETGERILMVEDNQELQCLANNKVHFYTGSYCTIETILIDILRWRPDRIIIGEVRDKSALTLLKTWNTGHPGGTVTVHADTDEKMVPRLAQLIEENNIPIPFSFIVDTIDYCVHITKDHEIEAGRRITGITELTGYNSQDGKFIFSKIF